MDEEFNSNGGFGYSGDIASEYGTGYDSNGYNGYSDMTDGQGRPLKHHYGLKLAFSIIEILSCCLLNPITMILGIISTVFTCGADTCFRQQRKEEFLRKARTATITLIIGLVMDIAAVIIWVMVIVGALNNLMELTGTDSLSELYGVMEEFSNNMQEYADLLENGGSEEELWSILYDAYSNGDLYEYFDEEYAEGTEDEYYYDTEYIYDYDYADPDVLGEYWKFTVNGIAVELPSSFSDFLSLGLETDLGDSASTYTLDANESYYAVLMDETGAEEIGYIQIYNPNDSTALVEECIVIYMELLNPEVYSDNEVDLSIELRGGISFGSTADEMIDVFGDASMTTEDDDFVYLEWCLEQDEYNDFVYVELYDDEVSIIAIGYAGDYVIADE